VGAGEDRCGLERLVSPCLNVGDPFLLPAASNI